MGPVGQHTQRWDEEQADSFTWLVTTLFGGKTESGCIHDVGNNPNDTSLGRLWTSTLVRRLWWMFTTSSLCCDGMKTQAVINSGFPLKKQAQGANP